MAKAWYGVDLDGTLAEYTGWCGPESIGRPIPLMVDRVRGWLAEGLDVRIFTARVADVRALGLDLTDHPDPEPWLELESVRRHIEAWCLEHIGRVLPITATKDYGMVCLWDDRCVQVIPNTGIRADGAE